MKMMLAVVAGMLVSFGLLAQSATGSWRKEADLLTPRAAHAVVAAADAIYAMAGTGPDGRLVLTS